MVTREENELLTRTNRGTPMGDMIRRYWVPALLSEEIPEPDCDPVRVRLLGENLVAFRDSQGRVGLMDENCPHRGASLFFGRNEEGGLRCLYHGFKMDVEGNVLDTPCEPHASTFRFRVKANAYPVVEQGDVIWAYLGPGDKKPAFPNFHWTLVPKPNRVVRKVLEECNWLQSMEGIHDSPHGRVLHDGRDIMRYPDEQRDQRFVPPDQECRDTRYGFIHIGGKLPVDNPQMLQLKLFAVPFHTYPSGPNGGWSMHLFVPMDDENNWYYEVRYQPTNSLDGFEEPERHLERGTDLDERYRKKIRRRENNYLQDRAAMRAKTSFSGLAGRPTEDMAMIESMGPIYDRTREHLGSCDVGVIQLRKRLLDSLKIFMEGGEPLGLDPTIPYDRMTRVVPPGTTWQELGAIIGDDDVVRELAGAAEAR